MKLLDRILRRKQQPPKPPTPEERERFKQFYLDRAAKRKEKRTSGD